MLWKTIPILNNYILLEIENFPMLVQRALLYDLKCVTLKSSGRHVKNVLGETKWTP